jgi:hypothetical protein
MISQLTRLALICSFYHVWLKKNASFTIDYEFVQQSGYILYYIMVHQP